MASIIYPYGSSNKMENHLEIYEDEISLTDLKELLNGKEISFVINYEYEHKLKLSKEAIQEEKRIMEKYNKSKKI